MKSEKGFRDARRHAEKGLVVRARVPQRRRERETPTNRENRRFSQAPVHLWKATYSTQL